MEKHIPEATEWTTSSHSMQSPIRKCVQVGVTPGADRVFLRDSMHPEQGALPIDRRELSALLATLA